MIELVLAAVLLLRDPPGDAVGAGGLVPPSAEQYRNVGSFDLLEVQILESSMLALTIEMGDLPNAAGLANGFSNAVIDVYVDLGEGGAEELLPGPEMRMPPGRGWEIALRITGDGATAYRSTDDPSDSGPSISYPVRVQADERVIRVETPFEHSEIEGVYALTGVYDPFVASGWRPLSESPSPWAFASNEQRRPVIDLLASDEVEQADAIRSGVLPVPRNRTAGAMWMLLMAVGVLVAAVGLVLRRWVVPEPAKPGAGAASPDPDATGAGTAPPSEPAGEPTSDPRPPPAPTVTVPTFLPALPPPTTEAVRGSPSNGGAESAVHTSGSRHAPGPAPAEAAPEGEHPEPQPGDRGGPGGAERPEPRAGRPETPDAFGDTDSWLDGDPEEDPEARTWRGDADRRGGADEPAAPGGSGEPESNDAEERTKD